MVIFNSKKIERTQQQKWHHDVSVTVSTVPSFFGDTGQFDSRRPGLGEGRKGKGGLMRVEKSEGGGRGRGGLRERQKIGNKEEERDEGGLRERQGNWNRDTDRHRDQALNSLWRTSFVIEGFQKQQELNRHRIRFRGKPPAPSLIHISVALEHPLLGLWGHRGRRLLGGGCRLEEGRVSQSC